MTCVWPHCSRTDIKARRLCVRHYRRVTVDDLFAEYPSQADPTPLVCCCDNPQPDGIGECGHCRRLVAATLRRAVDA